MSQKIGTKGFSETREENDDVLCRRNVSPLFPAARLWQNKSLFAYLSTLIMTHCGFILSSFYHYINGLQFVVWMLGYISLSPSPHLVRTHVLRCKFVSGGRFLSRLWWFCLSLNFRLGSGSGNATNIPSWQCIKQKRQRLKIKRALNSVVAISISLHVFMFIKQKRAQKCHLFTN